jgi:hypothetical protein
MNKDIEAGTSDPTTGDAVQSKVDAQSTLQTVGAASTTASANPPGFNPRIEVSAQTIARMMGIASSTEIQLLEGRLDLLASRVSTLMMKVDKVLAGLAALSTQGDIGRIETQIAGVKSLLRDATESLGAASSPEKNVGREVGSEGQSKRLKEGIISSSES